MRPKMMEPYPFRHFDAPITNGSLLSLDKIIGLKRRMGGDDESESDIDTIVIPAEKRFDRCLRHKAP